MNALLYEIAGAKFGYLYFDQPKKRGRKNKLQEVQVRDIRQHLSQGMAVPDIAQRYGVTQTTVYRIKNGKNHGHVK